MSTGVTLNGVSYTIPASGESNWGSQVTAYLVALATGTFTKAGGSFTLTAEADFGATYGLKAAYFKSRAAAAAAGVVRLGNTETISWRNAANGADKALKVNASDKLEFDGAPVVTLALGAADTVLRVNSGGTANEYAKIVNANVDAAAAIAYSKLNLGTSIVNADINGSAAIAYSKLNLGTSIVNADINGSAAIAYSKLALSGAIATGDLAAAMLVPIGKGGTGQTTANSSLNALLPSQGSNAGKVLKTDGTDTSWVTVASTVTTTRGDLIYRDASADARLPIGSANKVLCTDGTDPSWRTIVNADVSASAAIAYSKLNLGTSIVNADINASAAIDGTKVVPATQVVAGVLSTGAQNIAGVKTFYDGLRFDEAAGQSALTFYEEATSWTPTLSFTGGNGTATFSVGPTGKYTRIGKMVFLDFQATISKGDRTTQPLNIGNIPYNTTTDTNYTATAAIRQGATAAVWLAMLGANTSLIAIYKDSAQTTVLGSDLAASTVMYFTIAYRCA